MSQTPSRQKLTAEAAYENAHLVAQDLLARIRELLFDMPAPGQHDHPIHWQHVGDMTRVNAILSEAMAVLNRSER